MGSGPAKGASRDTHPEVTSDYDRARRPLCHAGTGSCTLVNGGLCQETGDGELLKYDPRSLSAITSIGRIHGTALASWSVWLHVFFYAAFACGVCAAVLYSSRRPELIDTDKVREVVNYASAFVAFVLAFYLSLVVARWWDMRTKTLGGLWSSIEDLTMILAAHFPRREHRRLKTLVLRYCLLSVELLFIAARKGQKEAPDLGELVRRQLLLPDEQQQLEYLGCRPQVVWVWISGTFRVLGQSGKLSSRMLVMLYGICNEARSAVDNTFVYLETQLPFAYVHLISIIVHGNNFLVAAKCGVVAAVAIRNLYRSESEKSPISDSENVQVLLIQLLSAIVIPLFYLALLEVGVLVSNPFGLKFQDFPRSAYHVWMRDECEAFQTAAEEAPGEISRVVEQVEVWHQGCVDDRVVLVNDRHSPV